MQSMLFTATKGRCGRDLTIVGLNSTYSINVKEYQGPIKNHQSIETGNTGHTKRRKTMQNKYVLDTTIHKQTQITEIRHETSSKQLEVTVFM
jgi:hypothetical protein